MEKIEQIQEQIDTAISNLKDMKKMVEKEEFEDALDLKDGISDELGEIEELLYEGIADE